MYQFSDSFSPFLQTFTRTLFDPLPSMILVHGKQLVLFVCLKTVSLNEVSSFLHGHHHLFPTSATVCLPSRSTNVVDT